MSVATANTAGHTKKVTTNAFLLIGYCLGNFIGPFFFLAEQAPRYDLGVGMMFFCIGVQVMSILGIWYVLWKRNKSRAGSNLGERDELEGYENGFRDLTDLENVHFKVSYWRGCGVGSHANHCIVCVLKRIHHRLHGLDPQQQPRGTNGEELFRLY